MQRSQPCVDTQIEEDENRGGRGETVLRQMQRGETVLKRETEYRREIQTNERLIHTGCRSLLLGSAFAACLGPVISISNP
jgi:hypothetical protein